MNAKPSGKYKLLLIVLMGAWALLCGSTVYALILIHPYSAALISLTTTALKGPQIAQSAFSPDRAYEAYVMEYPSLDPPNQTILIQRSDKSHFVVVGKLVSDVDSIRSIHWSATGDMVVFVTSNNMIAVLVPGFQTLNIPLADEFARYHPGESEVFGGGIPQYQVAEVAFPKPGVFAFRLVRLENFKPAGTEPLREIRLAELLGLSPQTNSTPNPWMSAGG
ncbi:MAG: hypothetical protein M1281_13385 [Chloroflexi bacterium]|nr:hypothetical protein [Chloroflexota bacterium]